jgi:hypothetical protein
MTRLDTLLSPSSGPPVVMEQTEFPAPATLQVVHEVILTVPTSSASLGPFPVHLTALSSSHGFQTSGMQMANHPVSIGPQP